MPIAPLSLGSGSSPSKYAAGGAARLINCYLEQQGEDSKVPSLLTASDGLTALSTMPKTGCRAMLEVGSYLYAVFGQGFYQVDSDGVATLLGTVPTTGLVTMARNRRASPQIGIVSGGAFWVYDTAAGTFTAITGPASATDFFPLSITFVNGYGLLPVASSVFYQTNLDDFTVVNILAQAQAESNSDPNVRGAAREGEYVNFGTRSTEFWQDAGGTPFAFQRSAAIELGCLSAGAVCNVDRTLIWVAHDGTVRLMQGYDGKRISNHAVERAIAGIDAATLLATSWWGRGHTFYCLSSPSWTWVYDLATDKWHERASYLTSRWKASVVGRFGTRWLAGDYSTAGLYGMSETAYGEGADPLVMTVQTPPVHASPYRLQFNALFLDIVPGVGLATGAAQDVAPEVMVSWSDNGGQTWGAERRAALGRQGDMLRRAVLRRLGVTGQIGRTFRISISAAVAKGLLGASVDVDRLAA